MRNSWYRHQKLTGLPQNQDIRILVTEDRPKTADLLRRALESEGHSVLLAYDGERALKLALTAEIDVILLDLTLPRMDGLAVLRRVRDARLNTPVIIVSARDAGPDIVQGLDGGADDYLTKPFELDILLARVRAVSRRAPAAHTPDLVFSRSEAEAGDLPAAAGGEDRVVDAHGIRFAREAGPACRDGGPQRGIDRGGVGSRRRCKRREPVLLCACSALEDHGAR